VPVAESPRRAGRPFPLPPGLPPPVPQTSPRREVRLRPALSTDAMRCATISTTYTTTHVWQLDTRSDGEEMRAAFRLVRLPRELRLAADNRPPAAPARKGLLWLVAEEVQTGPRQSFQSRLTGPPGAPAGAVGVVGYVAARFRAGDPCAYLQSLSVDPAHRRQGIGSRLLEEACRWAAREGAGRLLADAGARNYPALRLLRRAGLTFCGYNDRCYLKDEVAVFLSVDVR
jgi:ribosomal protein S18 acetylase RimI-like enzyme